MRYNFFVIGKGKSLFFIVLFLVGVAIVMTTIFYYFNNRFPETQIQINSNKDTINIKGVIRDFISEIPLEDVEITIGDFIVKTDENGKFTLTTKERELMFSLDGYRPVRKDFSGIRQNAIDVGVIDLIPKGAIPFLAYSPDSRRGRIMKTNYDGTDIIPVTEPVVFFNPSMVVSPDFKKVVYPAYNGLLDAIEVTILDVVRGKQLMDFRFWPAKIKRIDSFSWFPESNRLMWLNYAHNYKADADHSEIESWDIDREVGNIIPHPFSNFAGESLLNVVAYSISPKGDFVGFIVDRFRTPGRSVVLYDMSKRTSKVLRDGFPQEIFFDIDGVLYFNDNPLWIKHNPYTTNQENFKSKPVYWDKLKLQLFNATKTHVLYFCDEVRRDEICIADAKGNSEKKLLSIRDLPGVRDEKFYNLPFWSPWGKYFGIEMGSAMDKSPATRSLWIVSVENGKAKRIVEWGKKEDVEETIDHDTSQKLQKFMDAPLINDISDWNVNQFESGWFDFNFRYPKDWATIEPKPRGGEVHAFLLPNLDPNRSPLEEVANDAALTVSINWNPELEGAKYIFVPKNFIDGDAAPRLSAEQKIVLYERAGGFIVASVRLDKDTRGNRRAIDFTTKLSKMDDELLPIIKTIVTSLEFATSTLAIYQ